MSFVCASHLSLIKNPPDGKVHILTTTTGTALKHTHTHTFIYPLLSAKDERTQRKHNIIINTQFNRARPHFQSILLL